MGDEPSYFLVPASSGLCIQLKNGTIYTAEPNGGTEQQWYIEKGEGGQIAFRNRKDGQYLRGVGGGKGARVVTGQKQFWSLESSNTPNAFWIKCIEFPNAYLCNSYGKWSINNLIYIWAHELRWTQTMLWYVSDFETWEEHKSSKPGVDPRKRAFSELESKEKSVEDKQQKLEAKERELDEQKKRQEAKEREIEEKRQQQEAREKELQEAQKQAEVAAEGKVEEKERELARKQEEVDAKAKELAEREEQLGRRNNQVNGKIDPKQNEVEAREKKLAQRERQLNEQAAKLEREKEKFRQEMANGCSINGVPGSDSIKANRVQSSRRELEAATVGQRTAPLRMRTSQRKAIEKGELRPIAMPSSFSHLPRLRDG